MGLAELLKEDREFLEEYRKKFKAKFIELLRNLGVIDRVRGNLNYIADILCDSLLSLDDKNAVEKLKNVFWDLHKSNIPLGEILSQLLWDMLKDYINYLERENPSVNDIKKVKILAENLDKFLEISDEVFMKYMETLGAEGKEVETVPEEVNEILERLRRYVNRPVEVLAFYKVFPVLCKSRVVRVGDIFLTLEKCPYKVFIPGEKILIKLPGDKRGALAEIVNLEGNYMVVKPIKYEKMPARKTVKVFPEKEIDVKIETSDKTIYGFMNFLTFDEVGVITTSDEDITKNQKVKVEFKLPTGAVKTFGYVNDVEKKDGATLLKITLVNDFRNDQLISRYVLKRQQEILKELKI